MMDRLWHRVASMVSRRRVADVDSSGPVQLVTPAGLPDGIEHVQPFGLDANPPPGCEVVVLQAGAVAANEVVIVAGSREYRVRGLPSGGVCLYDLEGHRVQLDSSGITLIARNDRVQVQASAAGPNNATLAGLVHGSGVDPFTGLSYTSLGATTNQIKAEKT